MTSRRTRATSRQVGESPAPTRQTRGGSRRAEQLAVQPSPIPQRGTRRRQRRKSVESIATADGLKSSAEQYSPRPSPPRGTETEVVEMETVALGNVEDAGDADDADDANDAEDADDAEASVAESQVDWPEDTAAKLQDLLDFDLPKLHRWCEKTYQALSSLTGPQPTADERKNLAVAQRSFKSACLPLAASQATYINLQTFHLPYRDNPDAHAIFDKVSRSANLVSLLLSLTDLERSRLEIFPFLRELDAVFPSLLGSDFSAESEGHDLAFRVRYHRLLELLIEEDEIDPHVLATTVFCVSPRDSPVRATRQLASGPYKSLGETEQGDDFTSSKMFEKQMKTLIQILSLRARTEIELTLSAAFPRDELLRDLRAWALDMYAHVNKKTDAVGPPPDAPQTSNTGISVGAEGPEAMFVGDDAEPDESSDSDSNSQQEVYERLKTLTQEPSLIQDSTMLAAVRQTEGNRPRTEERLRNSLVGDGIRQLEFEDIIGSRPRDADDIGGTPPRGTRTPSPRPGSQELGSSGRKRVQPDEEDGDADYVDGEDDFEANEQLIDESRRQRYDSEGPRQAPKRPRFTGSSGRTRGRPRSLDGAPASSNFRERDLTALSQAVRVNRLANKTRGHQMRERWSDEDTDYLIDLIGRENLGCSWAAMEEQAVKEKGFEVPRNQQAIRDKARNLKKGYLCANAILPTGFDYVYLSKKERDAVIACGYNPDRREDDIDEDGHVIHNLLPAGL
ncbi:hypothetical protein F4777DRAFT_546720 [Nemania sp. FL0916]|nr:hypothetical protein F4777DRAFT_546720 [Nemania sp. FL0916]